MARNVPRLSIAQCGVREPQESVDSTPQLPASSSQPAQGNIDLSTVQYLFATDQILDLASIVESYTCPVSTTYLYADHVIVCIILPFFSSLRLALITSTQYKFHCLDSFLMNYYQTITYNFHVFIFQLCKEEISMKEYINHLDQAKHMKVSSCFFFHLP